MKEAQRLREVAAQAQSLADAAAAAAAGQKPTPQQEEKGENDTGASAASAEVDVDLSVDGTDMDLGEIILGDIDLAEVGTGAMPTALDIELATALGSRKEKDTKDKPPSKPKKTKGATEKPGQAGWESTRLRPGRSQTRLDYTSQY
jgi:hypothetical protein